MITLKQLSFIQIRGNNQQVTLKWNTHLPKNFGLLASMKVL